jgi:hypothetical protein
VQVDGSKPAFTTLTPAAACGRPQQVNDPSHSDQLVLRRLALARGDPVKAIDAREAVAAAAAKVGSLGGVCVGVDAGHGVQWSCQGLFALSRGCNAAAMARHVSPVRTLLSHG